MTESDVYYKVIWKRCIDIVQADIDMTKAAWAAKAEDDTIGRTICAASASAGQRILDAIKDGQS